MANPIGGEAGFDCLMTIGRRRAEIPGPSLSCHEKA
jgi:hypothetical protein